MLDGNERSFHSLLLGCLACLVLTTAAHADGRVFVLDLRNSSGLGDFRDAEQACASQHARLASAEELRHAVVECFFSSCTRGWLYGGTVGSTLCNIVGGALKAVDVRTENATEGKAHLDAFCIKDQGVSCGDPPSFPNARLQTHSGFEMGDELLYACVPGYMMPSGQSAFSLLCDSCGEWYGLVQICVKDESEIHVDYEDKFTDSYGEAERALREVDGAAYKEEKTSQEQRETGLSVKVEEASQGQHEEQEMKGQVMKFEGAVDGRQTNEEQAVQDFIGHPTWEQERREVVGTDAAAATEASVSLLSQKHMFWFPSEAFREEGRPVSTNPVTQSTQRFSGSQSEESKEHGSEEWHPHPVDDRDHERVSYDDHDTDDGDDSETDDGDDLENSHRDQDERDQDEDDHDNHGTRNIPAQDEDLNRRDSHEKHDEDHDDHYEMGEREDDHTRYGNQEYDDRDNAFSNRESYGDHEDVIDDRGNDDDLEHPRSSEEHPDRENHDDDEEHYDLAEDDIDHYTDHDGRDNDDLNSYDDHDSREDDGHHRVIFSRGTSQRQNITQKTAGGKTTTDETWLDGYPVVPEDTKNSTAERASPGPREREAVVRTTDRPNEVEIRRPVPFTSSSEQPDFPTAGPELERGRVEVLWPGLVPTAAPSHDPLEPSESLSYSDTLDYDTQQEAPTHSWLGDLTEHPFLDHGPAPPVLEDNIPTGVMEEHTMHSLPGETGERGNVEGERGETICAGDDCPPRPPSSSTQGPKVAAIIVGLCAVATAVIIGVWCYRRQQQKSSVYEMNGKGQSPSRQAQQIEMQQKV
ncbi:hypothetical protein Q5P01_018260 [Channa striata]|uniref:Sushi domain containing 5 n=1 Tax=Channa striata TaxID=64152 RepID=A0AA88M4N7_CHASR|nr:hypothetical protein Q5P01_018260 [Channa striata]